MPICHRCGKLFKKTGGFGTRCAEKLCQECWLKSKRGTHKKKDENHK